jgi:ADP-dependent glucokinase
MEYSRSLPLVGLAFLGLAIFLHNQSDNFLWSHLNMIFSPSWSETDMAKIISSWEKFIFEPDDSWDNVIIGFNANLDLVVPAIPLLMALNISIPKKPVDHIQLNSLSDLGETFAYHFSRGAAAERSFVNCELFRDILRVANKLPGVKKLVGGNAAIMSQVLHQVKHLPRSHSQNNATDDNQSAVQNPATNVTLIASLGPELRQLLSSDTYSPDQCLANEDEVHLIMEYGIDEEWKHTSQLGAAPGYRSAVANRFIFSCDIANTQLDHARHLSLLSPQVNDNCRELSDKSHCRAQSNSSLVIVSGFHMMEGIPTIEEWQERLNSVVDSIMKTSDSEDNRSVSSSPPTVHLELASMTSRRRMSLLASELFPGVVDSLGLNEQELAFLSQSGGGPHTSLYAISPGESPLSVYVPPMVERVVDSISWLLREDWTNSPDEKDDETKPVPPPSDNKPSFPRLRRVHFHTLGYHILGVRVNTSDSQAWTLKQLTSSVSAGAREGSRRACSTEKPEPSVSLLRLPVEEFRLGSHGRITKFGRVSIDNNLDTDPFIITWQEDLPTHNFALRFAMSPVLVCKSPTQTVGLGDSISITALLYSPTK